MAKLDGTNGLIQQYDYQTPTTGFSYTFASGTQTLIMNPAGTLATGTITMPAAPADGMVIWVTTTQQIVALTVNGNTGQTVVSKVTSLAPNQAVAYLYRASNTTWYPFETQMAQGNGPAFSATRTAAQSISAATWTKVQFSTEEFDTANCYDPTTNYRFTPNVAGYYLIISTVETNSSSSGGIAIYKNGSTYRRMYYSNPGMGATGTISTTIYMNGTTDYVESYVYVNSASSLYTSSSDYEFSGCLIRSA